MAAGQLRRLPPSAKSSVRALTDEILADPSLGKALKDELNGFYSVRHNRYRIIYEVDLKRHLIVIEYVGLRGNIYEAFARLKKKL